MLFFEHQGFLFKERGWGDGYSLIALLSQSEVGLISPSRQIDTRGQEYTTAEKMVHCNPFLPPSRSFYRKHITETAAVRYQTHLSDSTDKVSVASYNYPIDRQEETQFQEGLMKRGTLTYFIINLINVASIQCNA